MSDWDHMLDPDAPPPAARDLLGAAANLLAIAHLARETTRALATVGYPEPVMGLGEWDGAEVMPPPPSEPLRLPQRREWGELAVIAAAAKGLLDESQLERVPAAAWTSDHRLLAWICACRSCRALGRRSTFFASRHVLATLPRMDLPLDAWAAMLRGAENELDLAEGMRTSPRAVDDLLEGPEVRSRRCLEVLLPVLDAMSLGEPMPDTARRLRAAAQAFEASARSGGRAA